MIKIVAKRYYIENGPELQENLLREVIQASFPPFVLANSSEDELVSNVKSAFYAVSFLFTIHVCSCRLIWSSIVSRRRKRRKKVFRGKGFKDYCGFFTVTINGP